MSDKRACFDFDVRFSNGGGLQGQGFRLDISGDAIDDEALAAHVIRDLRLLMVEELRILNKSIIEERHKRAAAPTSTAVTRGRSFVDLSHTIESGMVTYKGLPAPLVCDWLSREQSREHYAAGTEFHIGRIDMVANTGTYLDTPFHRFADGYDVADLDPGRAAGVDGIVVRVTGSAGRAIDWTHFAPVEIRDRAVLVNTGWDRHWRTDRYFEGHPFLTGKAGEYLRDHGAALVGIDSLNIDDTGSGARPVHTVLLRAGIPIVEHMTRLDALPETGFRFTALPPKIRGMGTFPVRAFAEISSQESALRATPRP